MNFRSSSLTKSNQNSIIKTVSKTGFGSHIKVNPNQLKSLQNEDLDYREALFAPLTELQNEFKTPSKKDHLSKNNSLNESFQKLDNHKKFELLMNQNRESIGIIQ